jgi:periplasmic protein TonB
LIAVKFLPDEVYQTILPDQLPKEIVWLVEPGPGGGGGGGNKSPEPPKPAELKGQEKITVPAVKPPEPTPELKPEPPVEPQLNIPAQVMASADATALGNIAPPGPSSDSRGSGTGTGVGPGQGSGLGPGSGGGTGGGVYEMGSGVLPPRIRRKVDPKYTADAMRAKIQGTVEVSAVVMPDGSVSDVRVVNSLDRSFGLDEEAIKAASQWQFYPGTRLGEPVPVRIRIVLEFHLR